MQQLTALDRTYLRQYLKFRDQPMTVAGLFRSNLKNYCLQFTIFGACAVALYYLTGLEAMTYVAVVAVTVLLRDFGFFRRSVNLWPMTEAVTDWQRIEELLDEDEAANDTNFDGRR